ncbi:MAG: hypothetical protein AB1472_00480 [Candidatus Omnitrophota bacterium]
MIIKEIRLGKHKANKRTLKAQAVLETTLALTLVFVLLLGSLKIFVWLNQNLVNYQKNFQETRWVNAYNLNKDSIETGSSSTPVEQPEETAYYNEDKKLWEWKWSKDGVPSEGIINYAESLKHYKTEKLKIFD